VEDEELHHYWCCNELVAMCGKDLTNDREIDYPKEASCIPCARVYLTGSPCPVAGCTGGERE
jgi:hypothetical protein